MNTKLKPPKLEEIGFVLWGAGWRDPMGEFLDFTEAELQACEDDPDNIPAGTELRLLALCEIRAREIEVTRNLLETVGLQRTVYG